MIPWRLLWRLHRVKHRFTLFVGSGFSLQETLLYTVLCPRGHPKRAAELRVLIHGVRDWCREDREDWATWQDAIR